VGRVPDQPDGVVAALGEQALQQERDLPVAARGHYAHAVSLLSGIIGGSRDISSGRCCDRQGPLGPPEARQRSGLQAPVRTTLSQSGPRTVHTRIDPFSEVLLQSWSQ
jgi:hypothetical protein